MSDPVVDEIVKGLTVEAARIASEGNGLPLATFTALAQHILLNLAGYRHRGVLSIVRPNAITQQDVDYLARNLQSVYANLQDYEGEIP